MDRRTWWRVYVNHLVLMPDNSLAEATGTRRSIEEGDVVAFNPYEHLTADDLVAVIVQDIPTVRHLIAVGDGQATVTSAAGPVTIDECDLLGKVFTTWRTMHYADEPLDTMGGWVPFATFRESQLTDTATEWGRLGVLWPWDPETGKPID